MYIVVRRGELLAECGSAGTSEKLGSRHRQILEDSETAIRWAV